MNRNLVRIREGIQSLTSGQYELISGTVVPGSVNLTDYCVTVLPTNGEVPVDGVMLSSVINNGNGLIMVPADGSNVVIGSVDGPGEWSVIKASDVIKVIVTIGSVRFEMNDAHVNIQNGSVQFDISNSVFKVNTPSESLYQLLKDCFTYITALTVSTPSGTSSFPINVADFNNLITRLDNLLTH